MPQTLNKWQLDTPVAFLIFNRPETTAQVFETIRKAKPPVLLVVADGPRSDRPGDTEKCQQVREIIEQVDWKCTVYKNYSEINLGCKKRVASGLDWVFSLVNEAIILEDDCLPHTSFFQFCEELLQHYRNDTRIMAIAGNNVLAGPSTNESYYFSRYNQIWGWATWKRAWQHYDVDMEAWPAAYQAKLLENWFCSRQNVKFWAKHFQNAYENRIDTWDYAWTFACWSQNALSIIPTRNLVSNIGFGKEATHTTEVDSPLANRPMEALTFPLQHPTLMIRNYTLDKLVESKMFSLSLVTRLRKKIKRFINI